MVPPRLDVGSFAAIPPYLARRLRSRVTLAADEVLGLLQVSGGAPAADPDSGLREGITRALHDFCALIEDSRVAVWEGMAGGYVEIGRQMAAEGRGLEELNQLLFRSARAVWHCVDVLAEPDFDQATLRRLADAQFSFIDAVSVALSEGHRSPGLESAGARRERRRRLLDLILAGPLADPDIVVQLAGQAGWRLPRTVAAVVLHRRADQHGGQRAGAAPLLPEELLVDLGGPEPRLLLADPDGPGRMRLLEPLLRDWIVAVGTTAPVSAAAGSLAWARDTLALARHGVLTDTELLRSSEHVSTLVIFRSRNIIDTAAATRLAPLESVPESQRGLLAETLLALLEHNFNATKASEQLHVHPQTVRYRLRNLEALFGADLHDPHVRLEIQMILHARLARPHGDARQGPPRPTPATDVTHQVSRHNGHGDFSGVSSRRRVAVS